MSILPIDTNLQLFLLKRKSYEVALTFQFTKLRIFWQIWRQRSDNL